MKAKAFDQSFIFERGLSVVRQMVATHKMKSRTRDVAVATTSTLAADAAAEIAELGGNAIDCGLAAAMCSINTQPGVCALLGGAFVTIWSADGKPLTIDGNVAVPGLGSQPGTSASTDSVELEYGGGVTTLIGAGSVAVPGTLAALHLASERFGTIPWRELMAPSIRAAREGFPLATACHHYLSYSGDVIFGRSRDGHKALHNDDGSLREAGSSIVVPHLADTLSAVADEGPAILYKGELGERIVRFVADYGGLLSRQDFVEYVPHVRDALMIDVGNWQIATNPPPAVGGASLAAMLQCFGTEKFARWDEASIRRLIDTQQAVLSFRGARIDSAKMVNAPIAELLETVRTDTFLSTWASGSTVHTSAVDGDHLACAITASSGYGSGDMPNGTGLWLKNCLGELELNQFGLAATPPGRQLPSNMAPSVARSTEAVLAIGSPGADRITTALHQFFVNFAQLGLDLNDAVAHPRMHLKLVGDESTLAVEPGLDIPAIDIDITRYEEKTCTLVAWLQRWQIRKTLSK